MKPDLCVKLQQYRLIEISGADVEKYLQGQLTCDVVKLAIGSQTLTCHCDPKGKISGLFRLYRHSATQFFIIIRKELLPEALVQLRKYAVFSKVVFTEQNTPIFGTTSGEVFTTFLDDVTVCKLSEPPTRYLFWGDINIETRDDEQLWDLLDIQNGVPILHVQNQLALIPQAINLQMLEQAISFTKGCYIGQETIARAKYRGANKRAMFTFVGEIDDEILPEIADHIEIKCGEHWKSTGLILSRVVQGKCLWLQVVMNKEIEAGALFRVGNMVLHKLPLPYNLGE